MSAELPVLGALLAIIQLADAVACAIPIAYLANEFDRLQLSSRIRQAIPPVKAAAGVGLLAGLWVPLLGAATAVALIAYFAIAIGFHIRVNDPPSKSVNAAAMMLFTVATLVLTYLPAI